MDSKLSSLEKSSENPVVNEVTKPNSKMLASQNVQEKFLKKTMKIVHENNKNHIKSPVTNSKSEQSRKVFFEGNELRENVDYKVLLIGNKNNCEKYNLGKHDSSVHEGVKSQKMPTRGAHLKIHV